MLQIHILPGSQSSATEHSENASLFNQMKGQVKDQMEELSNMLLYLKVIEAPFYRISF